MRIDSVTARAFGPLVDATLEFADGLTIVFGPNESAKSSWHAATYVALCGRPSRVQGQDERLFEQRHRPWGGTAWLAEAELHLDDGRRIGMRQNLLNPADRKAFDLDLGRDVSAEIMNDRSPDAAQWLGLDRRSFRATACVGQTQILDVMVGAGGLQTFLQRAAASAGGGPPIEAITRIKGFHDSSVGNLRRLRSPLAMAHDRAASAAEALRQAQAGHAEGERLWVELARARDAANLADERLGRAEWGVAAIAAADLAERVRQAEEFERELAVVMPDVSEDDDVATSDLWAEVSDALRDWSVVSGPVAVVDGSSVEPAPAQARPLEGSGEFGGGVPTEGAASGGGELSDAELWELARDLEAVPPAPDPAVEARAVQARATWAAAARAVSRSRWLIAGGLVGGLVGAGAIAAGATLTGASIVAVGVAIVLIGFITGRAPSPGASSELAAAEQALVTQQGRIEQAAATRSRAAARAQEAGLRPDPVALRAVARAREAGRAAVERDQYWQEHNRAEAKARLAQSAARRAAVESRLTGLMDRLGLPAPADGAPPADGVAPADEAAAQLRAWQERRIAEDNARRDRAQGLRERLAAVLAGTTLPQLRERAAREEDEAATLRARLLDVVDGETLAGYLDRMRARSGPDELPELRRLARVAGEARSAAEVALDTAMRDRSGSVGEAEEEVAAARAELDRITELGDTLALTSRFLEQAQERAHRSIAPRLNESVRSHLPSITGGRYTEVTVDPEDLAVNVRGPGGPPRPAHLLSFGTAEQVYLLLRIALAEQLVVETESCPLIFDDVTVHADPERTAAILDLLLAASARHQIIVFTQQPQVLEWAREHLGSDRHAIRELVQVTTV